jgi:hypothetical protein
MRLAAGMPKLALPQVVGSLGATLVGGGRRGFFGSSALTLTARNGLTYVFEFRTSEKAHTAHTLILERLLRGSRRASAELIAYKGSRLRERVRRSRSGPTFQRGRPGPARSTLLRFRISASTSRPRAMSFCAPTATTSIAFRAACGQPDELLARAKRDTYGSLTAAERRHYLHEGA